MKLPKKILLLGSGELGKEFAISAKRLGLYVGAADRYDGAPAQQIADEKFVVDMLNGESLEKLIQKFKPDIIVPEIEAIRTEKLLEFESRGIQVTPSANAAHLTMNRDAIRDLAANKLKLKTARFCYAESLDDLSAGCAKIGFPCVVKPIMSSSGKGQSVVKKATEVKAAWEYACAGMRGDRKKIIVEEFIPFDFEITLLTVKQKKGPTLFVNPIGHRQERGDYQESWMPIRMTSKQLASAEKMAKKITDALGGAGIFGVEFFVTKKDVYFSELSPRPHDTGMVTLISQNLSEFDLHLRAVLGLPIGKINYFGPSASAVVLADTPIDETPQIRGLEQALKNPKVEVRIFGKPSAVKFRRMGVALALGKNVEDARRMARSAASKIKVHPK